MENTNLILLIYLRQKHIDIMLPWTLVTLSFFHNIHSRFLTDQARHIDPQLLGLHIWRVYHNYWSLQHI